MTAQLLRGNNLHILPTLPDDSVDSIVTDPPYELGFMGKSWDSSGIAYNVELWKECLRVLKPGGHLIAFGGSRTYHRLACAVEDAGFEIRDQLMWVYGSGFPKSLDVSKAIDKAAGAERPVVGVGAAVCEYIERGQPCIGHGDTNGRYGETVHAPATAPATDAAREWQGWGTALKPAHEPMVLARKPLCEKTVADNVLHWGTGALNIDGARIATDDRFGGGAKATSGFVHGYEHDGWTPGNEQGRWPANFIHDGSDEVLELFPETKPATESAARFFYCAKPSKAEREAGLDGLDTRPAGVKNEAGRGYSESDPHREIMRANFHPTVKPVALMRYLIRLVTPPGGTVLDPFAGSGTTLVAAIQENKNSIGIELTEDYWPIIEGRISHAQPNLWTNCD